MDILQLRAAVAACLGTELGVYTLPNGETTPAIAVRAEGEDLSAHTTVEGLEAVILRDPDLVPIQQYSEAGALRRWTVFLVAWSSYVELEVATAKMLYTFDGSRSDAIPVARDTGPLQQVRVTLVSPSIPVSELPGPRVHRTGVYHPGVFA